MKLLKVNPNMPPPDDPRLAALACGVPELINRMLVARGIETAAQADAFLYAAEQPLAACDTL
ncbi:MAG: hypothetical protein FWD16_01995, partial [Clostridia bacterium]|nr:hypothetical protein [Clostridia bacterium]